VAGYTLLTPGSCVQEIAFNFAVKINYRD